MQKEEVINSSSHASINQEAAAMGKMT